MTMSSTTTSLIEVGRDALGSFDEATSREWLYTNGLGGFASGTLSGARTRRYHGLLVAALAPPAQRVVLVAKVDVAVEFDGREHWLTSNEFADGTVHPRGHQLLDRFMLDGLMPVWRYAIDDVIVEQRIWMAQGANTTYLELRVVQGVGPVRIRVRPLCAHRDFHGVSHGGWSFGSAPTGDGFDLRAFDGAVPVRIRSDRGSVVADGQWHWRFRQRIESARGLDDVEDLFCPGVIEADVGAGTAVTMTFTAEVAEPMAAATVLMRERSRWQQLLAAASPSAPEWVRRLHLAADQFVAARGDANDAGKTVIAGYPWFGDWGRDTMIALPGIALATGRLDVAASVLTTFAAHVSEGMLPNRFPDLGEAPEYNTVDATLWYFDAIDRYLKASGDQRLLAQLYPVLTDIIDWHVKGTRFGIRVDDDGLLAAGVEGVQLTWMDARVDGREITPRTGKAVEINALWYRALMSMRRFAHLLSDAQAAERFERLANRVSRTFEARFFNAATECLFDVIDGPAGDDGSIRPNQILALAIAPELFSAERARSVVDVCARKLWTPVGLRSLAPEEPGYSGVYGGGPSLRDGVYHQGTAWTWLLGPFAMAHYRVYGDSKAAKRYLEGVAGHLRQGCIGSVGEVFDGAAPHMPGGCFAQAWSVAEVLRAWTEIDSEEEAQWVFANNKPNNNQ